MIASVPRTRRRVGLRPPGRGERRGRGQSAGRSTRSVRGPPIRIRVNGIRISREDLDRDEEADEQQDDAQELAELEELGRAEPVEAVGDRRDERAQGDQRGRRRPASGSGPVSSARAAPGSETTKLTRIATGAISRLNRKWSPGWFGSSE